MVNWKQSSLRVRDGELLVSSFISSFEVKVIESDIEARAMAEGAREATGEKKKRNDQISDYAHKGKVSCWF